MAQHKAPTAVTVAPLQEKSGAGLWISRYWMHGAIVVLAIVAYIVVRDRRQNQAIAARDGSWAKLNGRLDRDPSTGLYKGEPAALAALATELKDTVAGASARFAEVETRIQARDHAGALAALDALSREHPDHPYVKGLYTIDGQTKTLVEALRQSIESMKAFGESHAGLYANPTPPADAPKVRLTTDQGVIVVALYTQLAPRHCENFLKLCREGFYSTTKIHRVVPNFMIQGGDPNSKAGEPATWGLGGPGYKVDAEPSDQLFHFAGVLAMAKTGGDTQSSGSQFYITASPAHTLDGQYTVFGTVVEGMEVVLKINAAPVEQNSDRPVTPAVITSTEVL